MGSPWRRTSCPGQQGRPSRGVTRDTCTWRGPGLAPARTGSRWGLPPGSTAATAPRTRLRSSTSSPRRFLWPIGTRCREKFSRSLLGSLPRNSTKITMLCKMHLMHVMFYWVAIVFSIFLREFVSILKYKYYYDLALVLRPKVHFVCNE